MVWIKSSRCDNNLCAEVSPGSRRVWIRASDRPGVVLSIDRADWAKFLAAVKEETWTG